MSFRIDGLMVSNVDKEMKWTNRPNNDGWNSKLQRQYYNAIVDAQV